MALDKSSLSAALKNIADNPPDTYALAAQEWAQAVVSYAGAVTPPTTTAASGLGALLSAFQGGFEALAAAPAMEAAMLTYGALLGTGMAPGFVAVPPAGPVGFADLWTGTTDDTQAAADAVATAIDDWMKTGTATPSGGGSPVNWA